ncbi:alpha-amylase family glycosyl hydrolase [Fodinicola acaciae]|uniref:alpha-amylase family glycosyl hydrolase n=1 Tax=Fodinicola acaciae TaxID=2681555 RepID=UPI0013D8624C|nr:alpha-amylase family glycosyl hydrolase [Fodinicola acaciae]
MASRRNLAAVVAAVLIAGLLVPAPAAAAALWRFAGDSLRTDLAGEKFYFVMPDRFANGDTGNDTAGVAGDRTVNGFDPTDKGWYHGGDLAGLTRRIDYVKDLGTTAIWMTPMFRNRWVQGEGAGQSAGYHGYWTTDFTQLDPHFGTTADMTAFIAAAHARGMKVFFDIVANHTADVIDYAQHQYSYRDKASFPYKDANGRPFDDRDYVNKPFPKLTASSFPYTPVFRQPSDATVKVPAWLNDVTLYHNRGDSTFQGESSQYGDFAGLDDLFTENPVVRAGMIRIFELWIDRLKIDGYRVDTVKHVNTEFWQVLAPAVKAYAAKRGRPHFFVFGEVFDANPDLTSYYTTTAKLQAVLDFPFQASARGFAAGAPAAQMAALFGSDDKYIDADSNAYSLPTFLGNHDMGRIGWMLRTDVPAANDAEILARDQLAHALLYFSRGNPVVYYGDEQGFAGTGGDQLARQDMFATRTAIYAADDLIGTDRTTTTDSYRPDHPLYTTIRRLADTTARNAALRVGAQIPRLADGSVLAFSRIDPKRQIEYVVVLNNGKTDRTVAVPTYSVGMRFDRIYPGAGSSTSGADRGLVVRVPALSAVVYKASRAIDRPAAAPAVRVDAPTVDASSGRLTLSAAVPGDGFNEVTFLVAPEGKPLAVAGTDDNAPYRVYLDPTRWRHGQRLTVVAVVKDSAGRVAADSRSFPIS